MKPVPLKQMWDHQDSIWGPAAHCDVREAMRFEPGAFVYPPQTPLDAAHSPLAASALDRLKDLGDRQYEHLAYQEFVQRYRWCTEGWHHLRDTFDVKLWVPVLQTLGMDQEAYKSLVCLAQQGPAGRCEANRLLWQYMKPAAPGASPYQHSAMVWMGSIRRARQCVNCPPRGHLDYLAWTPPCDPGGGVVPEIGVRPLRSRWPPHHVGAQHGRPRAPARVVPTCTLATCPWPQRPA